MIYLFLKQNRSWILFFIVLQISSNIIFYIDEGLESVSIFYINLIQILLFFSFLIWRYKREGNVLHKLLKGEAVDSTPIYFEKLNEQYEQELSKIQQSLNEVNIARLEEHDDILAWVHEMKSPMTAMRLMYEQIEPYTLREKIDIEWMRLHLLLDQRLHATRLSTIEKDNRFEKLKIQPIVTQEIQGFRSWCLEKGLAVEMGEVDGTVVSDAKWLAFIIRQLLSNAVKYSEENTEIRISMEQDERGHQLLHIQDFGIGIKQEDLPRVFQKSYTGTVGREKTVSTGMGLYLANQAANKLGLELKLTSQLGEGTIATIQFPNENEYHKLLGM
ncbi:MAG: sensor histidine kinase [Lysinibacillus sp.]